MTLKERAQLVGELEGVLNSLRDSLYGKVAGEIVTILERLDPDRVADRNNAADAFLRPPR